MACLAQQFMGMRRCSSISTPQLSKTFYAKHGVGNCKPRKFHIVWLRRTRMLRLERGKSSRIGSTRRMNGVVRPPWKAYPLQLRISIPSLRSMISIPRWAPRNWVRNRSRRTKQLVINMSAAEVNSGSMIHQLILEQGIFRFDCSSEDRQSVFPSFSFADSKHREIPITSNGVPSFVHTFEKASDQQIVTLTIFTWNTKAWGYGPVTTSLYQSHPWVLALLPSGEALGVLADTTKRWTVCMPLKWALGYQQCRWSYMFDKRVLEVAKMFRDKDIPCDVIWMGIDYMDGFRCFTFDSERFPDPVKDLHSIGIKAIWMLDPGIKLEKSCFVYDSGSETGVWIQSADGKPFIGEVWHGPCAFPDFTESKVRSWWANLVKDFVSNGVDGIWNDMNEPAVFKVVTKTMPDNNVHLGDPEFRGCQNHSNYQNVYGMPMARSTYEGMKLANENKCPFVLTRAGFIGSQRYAATWTGDKLSTWEHLHMGIYMVLQLSLSGQPLSGPDIGGFAGNATPRLFARWICIGAFLFLQDSSTVGHCRE